jgi:hypothetical protein
MLSYVQYVMYALMSTDCQKTEGNGEKLREECELTVCNSGGRDGDGWGGMGPGYGTQERFGTSMRAYLPTY